MNLEPGAAPEPHQARFSVYSSSGGSAGRAHPTPSALPAGRKAPYDLFFLCCRVLFSWCRDVVEPSGGPFYNVESFGLVLKLFNLFFGEAVAGVRFFFGFRPRLLGIGMTVRIFNEALGLTRRLD